MDTNLKNQFRNYIEQRSGLYFKDHDLTNIENVLMQRSKEKGFGSLTDYYNLLTSHKDNEEEFRELLNLLTINHTYFFRNKPHFDVLTEKVLPEIIERRRVNSSGNILIKIWSAGCSSGEEPYSISIILKEYLEEKKCVNVDFEVLATDASMSVLKKAQIGVYKDSAMRLVEGHIKSKYFSESRDEYGKNQYLINSDVKRHVNFKYLNLVTDVYPKEIDIIFCRNVIIYFDKHTISNVMNKFYDALADLSIIFIGYSESLQFLKNKFRLVSQKDAVFYQKVTGKTNEKEDLSSTSVENVSIDLKKGQKRNIKLFDESLEREKENVFGKPTYQQLVDDAREFILVKEYVKASYLLQDALLIDDTDLRVHYLQAELFINQGKFEEAKEKVSTILKMNKMFAPAYYLFGSICLELDDILNAKTNFNKAIYLDKDFVLAYFGLASAYKIEGKIDEAIRYYRNTLLSLSTVGKKDIIHFYGAFDLNIIYNICINNIERLKII